MVLLNVCFILIKFSCVPFISSFSHFLLLPHPISVPFTALYKHPLFSHSPLMFPFCLTLLLIPCSVLFLCYPQTHVQSVLSVACLCSQKCYRGAARMWWWMCGVLVVLVLSADDLEYCRVHWPHLAPLVLCFSLFLSVSSLQHVTFYLHFYILWHFHGLYGLLLLDGHLGSSSLFVHIEEEPVLQLSIHSYCCNNSGLAGHVSSIPLPLNHSTHCVGARRSVM